jgi:glycogen phosphorylase
LEVLYDREYDTQTANGGLGRLAAAFLDSMATLGLPAWGYGLRYDNGMFNQEIADGHQVEKLNNLVGRQNPFEIERYDVKYEVHFGGKVRKQQRKNGAVHSV